MDEDERKEVIMATIGVRSVALLMLDPCGVDGVFVVVGVVAAFASFEVYVVASFCPQCRNRSPNNRFVSLPLSVRAEKKAKKKKRKKNQSLTYYVFLSST